MSGKLEYVTAAVVAALILVILAAVIYKEHEGAQFMLECSKIHTPAECQAMWKAAH